jgi:Protein of unknown function (DUF4242)
VALGKDQGRFPIVRVSGLSRTGSPRAGESAKPDLRSARVLNEDMPDDVRLIRSYVLDEGEGAVRTICIYEATGLEAIRKYASRAGVPADAITPITGTVVVRPDHGLADHEEIPRP